LICEIVTLVDPPPSGPPTGPVRGSSWLRRRGRGGARSRPQAFGRILCALEAAPDPLWITTAGKHGRDLRGIRVYFVVDRERFDVGEQRIQEICTQSRLAFAELTLRLFPIDERFFAFDDALFALAKDIGVPRGRFKVVRVAGEIRSERFHGAEFFLRGHAVERQDDIHGGTLGGRRGSARRKPPDGRYGTSGMGVAIGAGLFSRF
jgi:hypothetical protein